jgi:hypothetical protein
MEPIQTKAPVGFFQYFSTIFKSHRDSKTIQAMSQVTVLINLPVKSGALIKFGKIIYFVSVVNCFIAQVVEAEQFCKPILGNQ